MGQTPFSLLSTNSLHRDHPRTHEPDKKNRGPASHSLLVKQFYSHNIYFANVSNMVYPSAPDVESQESTIPKAMEENTTIIIDDDDNDGKGMGIAIFILIIIGTVSAFFIPYLSSACYIAALVLASVLTCGCCCAKNYNLKPHVKKMATATLVTLVLLFIVSTIVAVMVFQTLITVMDGYDETTGTFSDDTLNSLMDGYDETTGTFSDNTIVPSASDITSVNVSMLLTLSIIGYVLIGLALIFSGIFTWGRKCGAPHA
jgi:hypothetical protein